MSSEPDAGAVDPPARRTAHGSGAGSGAEPTDGGDRAGRADTSRDGGAGTDASGVRTAAETPAVGTGTGDPDGGEPDGFGTRGWALVGIVVLSTLVVPGVVYLLPRLLGTAGVPYIVALLVLPMVPAILLGLTAVWSMAASGRR